MVQRIFGLASQIINTRTADGRDRSGVGPCPLQKKSDTQTHKKQYRVNPDGHGSVSPTRPVNTHGPNNKTAAVTGRTVGAVNNVVRLEFPT